MTSNGQPIYAYLLYRRGVVDPILVRERIDEASKLTVSRDKRSLERYFDSNTGQILKGMDIRRPYSLDHHTLVDVNPLVRVGILRLENLHMVRSS